LCEKHNQVSLRNGYLKGLSLGGGAHKSDD